MQAVSLRTNSLITRYTDDKYKRMGAKSRAKYLASCQTLYGKDAKDYGQEAKQLPVEGVSAERRPRADRGCYLADKK